MRMVLNYKSPLIIFFLAVVTAGLLSVAAVLSALPKILIAVQPSLIETAEPARRLLDGRALLPGQTERKPLAIILENHVDARPVAGLEEASVVYETIVEGDITRFFAVFNYDVAINRIGPVRSLRPFFIELAEEYNPVFFHAGGSPDALEQIKNSLVYNINEISADGIYFWRDSNRQRPHNLFTSTDQMRRAVTAKEIDISPAFSPWVFQDSARADTDLITTPRVTVKTSTNDEYAALFQYNSETNDYVRFQNGAIHKTERGIILKTDNIVVQHVSADIIDDYGRLAIDLQSGGIANVYRDGIAIDAVWKKENNRTRFYDSSGQEIAFNRGKIWVVWIFD